MQYDDLSVECVVGERRSNADRLLRILKADYYVVIDAHAQEHVDYLWHRRHVHWTVAEVERLESIASLFSLTTNH